MRFHLPLLGVLTLKPFLTAAQLNGQLQIDEFVIGLPNVTTCELSDFVTLYPIMSEELNKGMGVLLDWQPSWITKTGAETAWNRRRLRAANHDERELCWCDFGGWQEAYCPPCRRRRLLESPQDHQDGIHLNRELSDCYSKAKDHKKFKKILKENLKTNCKCALTKAADTVNPACGEVWKLEEVGCSVELNITFFA